MIYFYRFTFHIVNIKRNLYSAITRGDIAFTFHIVNIKLIYFVTIPSLNPQFTFHIVNIKPNQSRLKACLNLNLHSI